MHLATQYKSNDLDYSYKPIIFPLFKNNVVLQILILLVNCSYKLINAVLATKLVALIL